VELIERQLRTAGRIATWAPTRRIAAAEQVLAREGDGSTVGAYLEACLRWISADPKAALAAAAPGWAPRVRHEQFAALLRGKIDAGEVSGRLPSAVQLAAGYKLSRGTVTRALEALERDGVVTSVAITQGGRRAYETARGPKRRPALHRATSGPKRSSGD
jgi:DNA-binding transcriptional ArsR family regulator